MIRKLTLFAFLFLFACLGYAVAQSQGQYPPPQDQQLPPQDEPMEHKEEPQQDQAGQPQKFKGEIQKVDVEKKIITIRDEISRTTQDVDFNEATTFSKDAKSITIGDLKKGDKVSLEVDAQNIATKVEIAVPETVPPPEQKQ